MKPLNLITIRALCGVLLTVLAAQLPSRAQMADTKPSQESLDEALCKAVDIKRVAVEEINRLLSEGADPNAQCKDNSTTLYSALHRYRSDIVELLLDAGANITSNDLQSAILRTSPRYYTKDPATALVILKLMLDYGADVESPIPDDPMTQLAYAELRAPKAAEVMRTAAKVPPAVRRMRALRRRARETALASLAGKLPDIEEKEKSGDEAKNAGRPGEALEHFLAALKETPAGTDKDRQLREKAVKTALSIKPVPPAPEEAKLHAERAQAFLKRAQDAAGYERVVTELEQASLLAPWWAPVYYNLGSVREKAQDFEGAVRSLKLYLLAAPQAQDAEAVRKKIVDLGVAQEMEDAEAGNAVPPTRESQRK